MQWFGKRKSNDNTSIERPKAIESAPPRPPVAQQPVGFDTVLGKGATLEGRLVSNGNTRLDGTFTGTLEISGNVLVGENAQINADIDAKNISIAGMVRGNVNGNRVQLLKTASVHGDISATTLTTEEGAFIDGKITMQSKPTETPSLTAAGDAPATPIASDSQDNDTLEEVEATIVIDSEEPTTDVTKQEKQIPHD